MAKQVKIEIKGILNSEFGKSITKESKSLFGAIKTWYNILSESQTATAKDAIKEVKNLASLRLTRDEKLTKDAIIKVLVEIVKGGAKYQKEDGTLCMPFVKSYSYSENGKHVSVDLFKGYKMKVTYSVGYITESWNRYLKGTACTYVDKKFMSDDDILIKYVEMCNDKGYTISDEMQLAYDMLMQERELAEAV